ncbi:MAG TPA: hypothetical protein PLD38_03480 [Pyrinomonadaceae bacterium]|nr:hypothetical protein [Pyrinomonadaceae bacterium]HRA41679.1 hypothetical protein [Pyrinomonadaceae bacterium]
MDKRFCIPSDIAQIVQNLVAIDSALTAVEVTHEAIPAVCIATMQNALRRVRRALTCRHI